MARSPAQSPERAALAATHEARAQAQTALAEAEAVHDAAMLEYGAAQYRVDELNARIRELRSRHTYNNFGILDDINTKLSEAYPALEAAKIAAMPLGIETEKTQARVTAASFAPVSAQSRVTEAATAVIRAEATPVADAALVRLREAYDVILQYGPDLLTLVDRGLVSADIAAATERSAGGLLRRCRPAWTEFETKYRTSPWQAAKELLAQDPDAPLPR